MERRQTMDIILQTNSFTSKVLVSNQVPKITTRFREMVSHYLLNKLDSVQNVLYFQPHSKCLWGNEFQLQTE